MALNALVEELQDLFPLAPPDLIKSVLVDCNYDKNACAEVLLVAQENGAFVDPYQNDDRHHEDVAIVFKDEVVTVNRNQLGDGIPRLPEQTAPAAVPASQLNETYRRYAEEDAAQAREQAEARRDEPDRPIQPHLHSPKQKGSSFFAKFKGKDKYTALPDTDG